MVLNFNFTSSGSVSQNFTFGATGTGPYFNFNFSTAGYSASNYNFNFGTNNIYNILYGSSNNFTSVWVMNDKLYIGSNNALNIVDLNNNTLYDFYSTANNGRAEEELVHEQIIDISVN